MNRWIKYNEQEYHCSDCDATIVLQHDGYYLTMDSMLDPILLGLVYDSIDTIIQSANDIINDNNYKSKNAPISALSAFLSAVMDNYDVITTRDYNITIESLKRLLSLPSSDLLALLQSKCRDNGFVQKLQHIAQICDAETALQELLTVIHYNNPKDQDCVSVRNNYAGRFTTIAELNGITVNKVARGHYRITKSGDNKIFECTATDLQRYDPTGITITISGYNVDCTIDMIFIGSEPMIIINDRINDIHMTVPKHNTIIKSIIKDYGVNLLECLHNDVARRAVLERFGEESDDVDSISDDTTDSGAGVDDDQNIEAIINDVDPEVTRELEIIDNNIAKIEDLPDDIQEEDSIREIYLLLLGKRALLQKSHDESKSEEIVDNIIADIRDNLGEIDSVFVDNSDKNILKVEEGKLFECYGTTIKPIVFNNFGTKTYNLMVGESMIPLRNIRTANIKSVVQPLLLPIVSKTITVNRLNDSGLSVSINDADNVIDAGVLYVNGYTVHDAITLLWLCITDNSLLSLVLSNPTAIVCGDVVIDDVDAFVETLQQYLINAK